MLTNMKSDYVKLAIFADELHLSRIAVFKAGQRGTFPMKKINGVWHVDRNNKDVKAYKQAALERQKKPVKVLVKKNPKKKKSVKVKKQKSINKDKPVKVSGVEKQKEIKQGEEDLPYDIYKRLDSGEVLLNSEIVNLPKIWVDKIKIYEQTKQIQQKRLQERRELISQKTIRIVLGKLFEIHTNEFLTIKSKIIPDLAGIFKCTESEKMVEAEKRIDEELWKVLKHIKYEFNKFLSKTESESIN